MRLPTHMYHGTSAANVHEILENGLLTGDLLRKSNYAEQSRRPSPFVYLSHGWALHYALSATEKDQDIAIVKIDTAQLNSSLMRPDEDFYFEVILPRENVKPSTISVNDIFERMNRESERTLDCLYHMSNVAYRACIPSDSIVAISAFPRVPCLLRLYQDLTTEANFQPYGVHKTQFFNFLRLVFGEAVSAAELITDAQLSRYSDEQLQEYDQCLGEIVFTRYVRM